MSMIQLQSARPKIQLISEDTFINLTVTFGL